MIGVALICVALSCLLAMGRSDPLKFVFFSKQHSGTSFTMSQLDGVGAYHEPLLSWGTDCRNAGKNHLERIKMLWGITPWRNSNTSTYRGHKVVDSETVERSMISCLCWAAKGGSECGHTKTLGMKWPFDDKEWSRNREALTEKWHDYLLNLRAIGLLIQLNQVKNMNLLLPYFKSHGVRVVVLYTITLLVIWDHRCS